MRTHLYAGIITTILLLNIEGAAAQQVSGDRVLVGGTPPLTESMVVRHTALIIWMLDIPLTQRVWEEERDFAIQIWRTNDKLGMDRVIAEPRVEELTPTMLMQAQSHMLRDLQNGRAEGVSDEYARYLLSLYKKTHPKRAVELPSELPTPPTSLEDQLKKYNSEHGYGPGSVPSIMRELMPR